MSQMSQSFISEIPLPNNFENYDKYTQLSIIEYITHLSDIEKKAYKIAHNHLCSSFNVVKSNGSLPDYYYFRRW